MDNLTKLPDGTKLMWDASSEGFISGMSVAKSLIYTATKVRNSEKNPLLGALIKSGHNSNWMGDEEKYLRLPTKEELETLVWEL